MSQGYKDFSRDYSAIKNAGHNLVSNRGYSAYKYNRDPQDFNYGQNRSYNPNLQSTDTSRYDELDILDKFSQPLLQKQGGDIMGNYSSIQIGSNKRNNIPQLRGSSADPRNMQPYNLNPYLPPSIPPQYHPYNYQQPPPYGFINPKQGQQDEVAKLLQQQLDKQNEILSQLANNLDKNRNAQMNQYSQPPQPDYNQKLRDIEKEYEMMNEIQNLRREIGSIVNQKNQINPLVQQQQQQFQMMQMQQMMMNPYMNPMTMMLMNQMNQQNPNQQPPQQPFQNGFPPFYPNQSPPPQQPNKSENENRLEELLKQLLKDKALNNMQQNQPLPQYRNSRPSYQNRVTPSRQYNQNDDQIMFSEPSEIRQNQQYPNQNTNPSQKSRVSVQKPKQSNIKHFKKMVGYMVLFIRWLKLEVVKSKQQFKQYELEEFQNDFVKAMQDSKSWLINSSTKTFSQIVTNCKKEQDITDLAAKKLNAKDQELRFNQYVEECNTLIDDFTKNIEQMPEALILFITKKFYENSYFSNNPQYLFQFEIDRLEFDPNDQKLINIDNNPDSPRFKMLLLIYIFFKLYIPNILIKPWEQQLDPSIRMIDNYITTKKCSILCSIFYHQIMDYLKANVPQVQRKPNEVTWTPISKTVVINNSKQVQLQSLDTTKDELLTLSVTRDQLSTFYTKKQQWIEEFKQKINLFAQTVRQKLQNHRVAFLELRKELLQEKAKEMQKFIPQKYRQGNYKK